jgi:hypothetical protein
VDYILGTSFRKFLANVVLPYFPGVTPAVL